jgi:uroporphyrinogen-III decarboxylase
MKTVHWHNLLKIIDGELLPEPPSAFIIDSPWLPGWYGINVLNYYSSEKLWLEANLQAERTFPDVMFMPGFWSEFAMCTEPSAFGARMIWTENELPHAEIIINDISGVNSIKDPNPKTDGLLPFIIQRLVNCQTEIQKAGYDIKFAIARGPLNIASFLMGSTEFMMSMMMDPDNTHKLLEKITRFTISWLEYQKEKFPSIDGILILDDIVGFIGDNECRDFAVPYLKRIFSSFNAKVNFFHNDAQGLVSTPYLKDIGVNLFNFSFEHSLQEIRDLAGGDITLMGNLPPRDVLAAGTPEQVYEDTLKMYRSIKDKSHILWSAGGGMPPGVSTENIRAFTRALRNSL